MLKKRPFHGRFFLCGKYRLQRIHQLRFGGHIHLAEPYNPLFLIVSSNRYDFLLFDIFTHIIGDPRHLIR